MALIDEQFPATITVWRKGESIQARHSSLKDVTLPDGTIQRLLRDGAVGKFANKTTGEDRLKLRWNRKWWPVPTLEEVQTWTLDSVCPTPAGDIVEPDHPDAWLSLLGLV